MVVIKNIVNIISNNILASDATTGLIHGGLFFSKRVIISSTIIIIPIISYAQDYSCASVGASMEMVLFEKLSEDLKIDTSIIQRDKTQVKIIDILPVSKKYSESIARIDYNNDQDKDKTENKHYKIYLTSYDFNYQHMFCHSDERFWCKVL